MGAIKIRLPLLLLVLASAALTAAAGLMLFSTFMLYDDEGYVLFSLRNFVEHGQLYGKVYTQYGPFSYVLYYLLHLLGMPLTHTAGRVLTLLAWSGSATLTAWTTGRATRSTTAMLAVLAAVFVYLWIMVSEPNHPGGLIALTTAIMAALGCKWLAAGRWPAWAAVAGAGTAVLLLTKINIGVFAALSTLALLLLHSSNDRVRRAAPWVLAGGFALLPLLLMRPLLGTPWVQTYALLFALSAVAAIGAAARATGPHADRRAWRAAVLAGGVIALLVLGVIFARGTTPAEVWSGVILGPLRHPGHFSLVFPWPPGVCGVAIVSLGLFVLASLRARRSGNSAVAPLVAWLRLLAATALAVMILRFPAVSPDNLVFSFAAPCLWLFLWPLDGEEAPAVSAQVWLGLLFLGQFLHPYPVPGSQIAWGTFLTIPLAAIGGWSAAVWLARQPVAAVMRFRAARVVLPLALLVFAVVTGNRLAQIGRRYLDSRSLDVPGAETVRLPDSTTALYRLLVFNAEVHSDMLFSLPGMFSFNLWSGLPAPTLTNVTHWFSLLDDPQQQAIIQSLESHPRAVVIVQEAHLEFLRQRQLTPGGPLYDYVMSQFETAFEIDGFQFRVRRGRHVAPLLTGEIFGQKTAAQPKATAAPTLVKLLLLLPPGQAVARVDIAQMDDTGTPPLILNGANAQVEVTPIDLQGNPRGPAVTATFPFKLQGPSEVALYFDRGTRGFSTARTFLVVRDAAGAELALVRLRP